ncbi:MAG: DUF2333 family protein [Methylococcales bacterium]|nr:DUF2333 family protein [Methylococcales bacterium]MCK5924355.1 DUF2333 family protein [Methylococcales bacterium]
MEPLDYSEDAKSKGILWSFGGFIAFVLLVLLILGAWWGSEPDTFDVKFEALARYSQEDIAGANVTQNIDDLPIGYVYTNTLAHMAEVLMHKPGGYLTNDVAPPGVLLDNVPSWEYGALIMLRDGTTALRNHFARDQSQSAEDVDLSVAEPYFYYERNSWALPSTEAEYEKGINALHRYMSRLKAPRGKKRGQFYSRADNLWQYSEVVIKRLGGLSTRLGASTDRHEAMAMLFPDIEVAPVAKATIGREILLEKTSWLEIDDVFYEARGASWALLHILKAIEYDFRLILEDKRAMRTLKSMIYSLENALTPVTSPMILNGSGFGFLANYSLSMANYIARANAAALDLRDIMNRG